MRRIVKRNVFRRLAPWWAKGALKLGLSLIPVDYSSLRALGLARHGGMERPNWAYEVFRQHLGCVAAGRRTPGSTVLELGPGDSLLTALVAKAHGASAVWLVDVAPFATQDLRVYRAAAEFLTRQGLPAPDLAAARSVDDVLAACSARYLTDGLRSLRTIPAASVDFAFSNTVLQHVWRDEFPDTVRELRRVLRPGGCGVHTIDFRDMLGQSLHHLRWPGAIWESRWCRRAGFYTNRLRPSEMLDVFRRAGFAVEAAGGDRWPHLPVRRRSLARAFRDLPDDDLLTMTLRVVLRASASGPESGPRRRGEQAGAGAAVPQLSGGA
jgi:SAM-dependent methyltransferase